MTGYRPKTVRRKVISHEFIPTTRKLRVEGHGRRVMHLECGHTINQKAGDRIPWSMRCKPCEREGKVEQRNQLLQQEAVQHREGCADGSHQTSG